MTISFLLAAAPLNHAAAPVQDKKIFTRLYALEGLWVRQGKKGNLYEEWTRVTENHLQARIFRVKEKDTIVSERVSLIRKQQQIVYVATVVDQNDQQPVPFFLVSARDKTYIFENPTHDYPKRVVYRLASKDSLHAWIDGGPDTTGKRVDYHYTRLQ